VEDHKRHHVPLGGRGTDSSAGTIHSTASMRGGSWPASTRRRSCSRETLERVQFDIATAKSWASWKCEQWRCCGCERTQSSSGEREREEVDEMQSPEPALDARF
jgi:hypothetical protein